MVHSWWCCLFSDSNDLRDIIIVDVVEILTIPFHSLNYFLVNITSFTVMIDIVGGEGMTGRNDLM